MSWVDDHHRTSSTGCYQKGMIADPVNKAKSVVFTEEELRRAEELFRAMFTKPD